MLTNLKIVGRRPTEIVPSQRVAGRGQNPSSKVDAYYRHRCSEDGDVAIAIAIVVAVGTGKGNVPTVVTVAVAVVTAVAVKTTEVETPV